MDQSVMDRCPINMVLHIENLNDLMIMLSSRQLEVLIICSLEGEHCTNRVRLTTLFERVQIDSETVEITARISGRIQELYNNRGHQYNEGIQGPRPCARRRRRRGGRRNSSRTNRNN